MEYYNRMHALKLVVFHILLLLIFHFYTTLGVCCRHTIKCSADWKNMITRVFEAQKNGTVLIIGANVGENGNDATWSSLLEAPDINKVFVEPVPFIFEQLERNIHRGKLVRSRAVNAAVLPQKNGISNSSVVMWCTGMENRSVAALKGFPDWVTQICTLKRERLFSSIDIAAKVPLAVISKFITKHIVPGITIENLIFKYVQQPLLVLQIDVEGLDDKIITNFPLSIKRYRPEIIRFEHQHLSSLNYIVSIEHLHKNGYNTCIDAEENINTVAIRTNGTVVF